MDELTCTAGVSTENLLFAYLFTFFVRSDQLYKQLRDNDKDTFEAEFGRIERTSRERKKRASIFVSSGQAITRVFV